jgi:hypothetical protein
LVFVDAAHFAWNKLDQQDKEEVTTFMNLEFQNFKNYKILPA